MFRTKLFSLCSVPGFLLGSWSPEPIFSSPNLARTSLAYTLSAQGGGACGGDLPVRLPYFNSTDYFTSTAQRLELPQVR